MKLVKRERWLVVNHIPEKQAMRVPLREVFWDKSCHISVYLISFSISNDRMGGLICPTCLPYLQNSLKIPGDGVISVKIASFKII